jgi:DUF4097 and DUF4098 domain-containing protein YvlB
MRRFRSFLLLALVTGAPLLLSVRDAGAQTRQTRQTRPSRQTRGGDFSSRIDTTFAFDKSGSITVSAGNGDIVVTGWSRDEVHVRAVSDDDNIRFNASSARMTIEVNGGNRGSDTRFEVSVPYGVRVLASGWSGDISVRGTRGQVETHSQSGDIHVEDVTSRLDVNTLSGDLTASNISGDAEIESISGDVKLTDVRGNVDVGTVSGNIELRGMTTKVARAKTTSGDITYDGIIDPAGRYEMTAHSGDIGLHIPRDASAQLNVSTWSGGFTSDFPVTLKPGEHGIGKSNSKAFTFEIGSASARITVETFNGDVTVSSNGRGANQPR